VRDMFTYYLDRGLSAVEIIVRQFDDRIWYVPNLICDEVLDKIKEKVSNIVYYEINDDFGWAATIGGAEPKVFYIIDYFGKEFKVGSSAPPNTIVIRDSVWFPYPYSRVEGNQIWFNSLRKIFRGAKGCSMVSGFRFMQLDTVPNLYYHPYLSWEEADIRFKNYYKCIDIFNKHLIDDFLADFPTVFPIRLKNRDEVLERAGLTGKLPGMWKNKHGLDHTYYKELTFIPIDSRFNEKSLTELASKIDAAL